jgi:predicted metalloprotease with PDZ domain
MSDEARQAAHPNLRRGNPSARQSEQAALDQQRERYADTSQLAADDLMEGTKRVYGKLLALAEAQLDLAIRQRGEPQRVLVDVAKELRQTADKLHEFILAHKGAAETEQFFADLAARLDPVATRLEVAARPAPVASARPA